MLLQPTRLYVDKVFDIHRRLQATAQPINKPHFGRVEALKELPFRREFVDGLKPSNHNGCWVLFSEGVQYPAPWGELYTAACSGGEE